MRVWIARDARHNDISLHIEKPIKKERIGYWLGGDELYVPESILPEGINPQWSDDEPIEVELKIEKI